MNQDEKYSFISVNAEDSDEIVIQTGVTQPAAETPHGASAPLHEQAEDSSNDYEHFNDHERLDDNEYSDYVSSEQESISADQAKDHHESADAEQAPARTAST